jgi:hypothetical protein
MRSDLADTLLAKVLDWKKDQVSEYTPKIAILSQMKYDEYQQFFPGLRFTESLASWLNKKDVEDRELLFKFIIEKLIFISSREMNQLVSQAFPDFIRPILYKYAASNLGCSEYNVNLIEKSIEYKRLLRKTLFLGLSDGARTDVLRRFNPFISHEQVLPFYLIPEEKYLELLEELASDLEEIGAGSSSSSTNQFSTLVLLDDFTASGTSYFKYNSLNEFKGKVVKILNGLKDDIKLGSIFDKDKLQIILVIYIATKKAINIINEAIKEWIVVNKDDYNLNILFEPIYELTDSINITLEDNNLCNILNKYFDRNVLTDSYMKGKHDSPFLGFDECGLPLILNHNTPNNSVCILWNEMQPNAKAKQQIGLFPRVSRHKK